MCRLRAMTPTLRAVAALALSLPSATACVGTIDDQGGGGSGGDGADRVDGGPDAERPVGLGSLDTVSEVTCAPVATFFVAAGGIFGVREVADPGAGGAMGSETRAVDAVARAAVANGHGVVYTVDPEGRLRWHRLRRDGTWADGSGAVVRDDWGDRPVISGGDGILYTVDDAGQLRWFRHLDPFLGQPAWADSSGVTLDHGWGDARTVIGAGDGVLYAIDGDGALRWARHQAPFAGGTTWVEGSGAVIGAGWDRAASVGSPGAGVLYAVIPGGEVLWFRHRDPSGGAASWAELAGAAVGEVDADAAIALDPTACFLGDSPDVAHAEQLTYGLHPDASDALRAIGIDAGRITQTIGDYAGSAGTHAQDGVAGGMPYSCATDISVTGWTEETIARKLENMGQLGFAGWYRKPGADGAPSDWSPHIHTIWTGAPMKLSLRDQVRDWLADRNGLVGHAEYQFLDWTDFARSQVRKRFLAHNPGVEPP